MSAVETPWGYTVEVEGAALPPLVSADELAALTGGLASDPGRVEAVAAAVSDAVRAWCGWHVSPTLTCRWVGEGEGRYLALPCMGVSSVGSLRVAGAEAECRHRPSGLVRLVRGAFPPEWGSVEATFRAGYPSAAVGAVVAQIAANAVVAAPGVAEEHAGSVGVTYNRTGDGVTGGVSLLPRDLAILAPYRLTRW